MLGFAKKPDKDNQLEHITQEMYKQNLQLAERNKTLTLLRQIDEIVLGSEVDIENSTQAIADLLITADFSLAMIYVSLSGPRQVLKGFSSQAKIAKNNPEIVSSLGNIPLTLPGKPTLVDSMESLIGAADKQKVQSLDNMLEVKSLFICPLVVGEKQIGSMMLGLPFAKEQVSDFFKSLVDRLTNAVSIAVQNRILNMELQVASTQLRIQNEKLKQLDKTKDEFISMASHQLRTPLTAIKGYLSMVLEGDVGPVTENEKEYIQRAFAGAQKMVYLIADMLNVSRLQTGKFVIDNQPTDMVQIIEEESGQLETTAQEHNVKLIFNKPAQALPMFNLDTTKIRQVVMNFLDNAIYYTRAGGTVTADLKLTDKELVFTVTDTGIGVPASVQPHLFTKFYRADNAKQVRADGTGLGLFMAKKVVTAQGGAIIFKSVEGKGSTFGFSFPRASVEIKPAGPPTSTINRIPALKA